jgi:hypothetical protein
VDDKKNEFRLIIGSDGSPRSEMFYCWAIDEDDAIRQAWAWKPHGWVISIKRLQRAITNTGMIVSTWS